MASFHAKSREWISSSVGARSVTTFRFLGSMTTSSSVWTSIPPWTFFILYSLTLSEGPMGQLVLSRRMFFLTSMISTAPSS